MRFRVTCTDLTDPKLALNALNVRRYSARGAIESNTDRVYAPCALIQAMVFGSIASMNRKGSITLVPKYISSTARAARPGGVPLGAMGFTRSPLCAEMGAAASTAKATPRIAVPRYMNCSPLAAYGQKRSSKLPRPLLAAPE